MASDPAARPQKSMPMDADYEHREHGGRELPPAEPDGGSCAGTEGMEGTPRADEPSPSPAPLHEDEVEADATRTTAAGIPPAREVKLVVTLRRGDAADWTALLAVGTDGCDPVFRSVTVPSLAGALDAALRLAAEAERQWQTHPRYPAAALPPRAAARGGRHGDPAPATPADGPAAPNPDTPPTTADQGADEPDPAPALTTKAARPGQLSLFD